ncbi:hypothetical protein ACFU76_12405 [Streptomyces sp. NPDC057539]|uniref:hypothetical protein n=1 Tax=Streptomyces sp. NPDC057539 TaxID=3346159 RepID=UPI00368EB5A5
MAAAHVAFSDARHPSATHAGHGSRWWSSTSPVIATRRVGEQERGAGHGQLDAARDGRQSGQYRQRLSPLPWMTARTTRFQWPGGRLPAGPS